MAGGKIIDGKYEEHLGWSEFTPEQYEAAKQNHPHIEEEYAKMVALVEAETEKVNRELEIATIKARLDQIKPLLDYTPGNLIEAELYQRLSIEYNTLLSKLEELGESYS